MTATSFKILLLLIFYLPVDGPNVEIVSLVTLLFTYWVCCNTMLSDLLSVKTFDLTTAGWLLHNRWLGIRVTPKVFMRSVKPLFENASWSLLCLLSFYLPPPLPFRHSAGRSSSAASPLLLLSIETAWFYSSRMWTVDDKMDFTHSLDDERRWETGRTADVVCGGWRCSAKS